MCVCVSVGIHVCQADVCVFGNFHKLDMLHHVFSICHKSQDYIESVIQDLCIATQYLLAPMGTFKHTHTHTHSLTEIDSLTHTFGYKKGICREKRM